MMPETEIVWDYIMEDFSGYEKAFAVSYMAIESKFSASVLGVNGVEARLLKESLKRVNWLAICRKWNAGDSAKECGE